MRNFVIYTEHLVLWGEFVRMGSEYSSDKETRNINRILEGMTIKTVKEMGSNIMIDVKDIDYVNGRCIELCLNLVNVSFGIKSV
jgi:hypothetical protein